MRLGSNLEIKGNKNSTSANHWYQWEGGGYKERVEEGECDGNIMYSCMKMEK
jgi:hypothetical protein